ncbi:MAG: DUF2800 domain-containing protein, partial [Acetanaerobacterium sp.]
MPGTHALLSASSASRWMRCTPSARLEEQFADTTSEYAAEGTLAHSIAELKLRKHFLEPMGPRTFNKRFKKLKEDSLYQDEMDGYTDQYLDYITGVAMSYKSRPYVAVERRVDYSSFAPEGFGTSDCIVIGANTMHVIDLKYGKGVPVSAEDNPQMKLYALGALSAYSMLYDIQTVVLTIVQPRLDNISEFTISRNDLLDWGVFEVKPKAKAAYDREGDYCAGEHCRFCRAKAQCRARSEFAQEPYDQFGGAKPPLISNDEVGQILERAQAIKKWATDLEEYALSELLRGDEIPGWKAVEGRSVRQFIDTDAAFAAVKDAGYDEALL